MQKEILKVDVLSLGTILGLVYIFIGLIIGIIFALASSAMSGLAGEEESFIFSFGALGIVLFPLIYGVIGFIGGIITAAIYNLVAGWVGGLKVTIGDLD